MNRRRMMMAQNKPDLLKGYRFDNMDGRYNVYIKWLDNNTLHVYHTRIGFGGPDGTGKAFIGGNASSSAYLHVFPSTLMNTFEMGKNYKLTLTVIEITQNTATADNDGEILLCFGKPSNSIKDTLKFSELKVGDELSSTSSHISSYNSINGAAFNFTNPALQWDITFKVKCEEVS